MKCSKCGAEITKMNHHYVPAENKKEGKRYCLRCTHRERVVTLV
jgi:DNA-directed RNA polymerase subunit RPC12/RpoP